MRDRRTSTAKLSVESLEQRHLLSARPVISEFLADNAGSLTDGDGRASDWIELFNAGDAATNLQGWYLTDDPANLQKWPFPNRSFAAGEYLVVFASNQATDAYVDPAGNLHTNFALNDQGEYLALVEGTAVRQEFSPEFPRQLEDSSYGLRMATTSLVGPASPLEYLVPTSDALEPAWRSAGFSNPNLVTGTPGAASSVVLSELGTGNIDFVEIQNVSAAAANTAGWSVVVNQAATPAVTNYASLVISDPGLAGYWRLNENVAPQGLATHGQTVINRDGPDSFHGVAVFDTPLPNGGNGSQGRVTTWQFFNNTPGTAGRLITPLLLEDVGTDQYMVRGIGTTRAVTEAGLQTWDFTVSQGTDTFDWTLGRFHMGIRYGSPTVSNPGVVEFSAGANGWDFFGSAAGAPNVVLNNQITGGSSFNNLGRDYSVQFNLAAVAGGGGVGQTAVDATGAHNGVYTTTGVTGNRPGAIVGDANKSVDFAGGEVTVAHGGALASGGTALTVEAWAQIDTIGAARWLVSQDASDASATPGLDYQLGIDATGRFVFRTQGTGQSAVAPTATAADGTVWHHVIGVQDPAAGNVRLYVDGVLRATAPLATTGVTSNSDLKIGDRGGLGGNQNLDGRIDEVAIYHRALSTSDIANHYLAGKALLTGSVNRANPLVWNLPGAIPSGGVLYRTDNAADNDFGSDIAWDADGPGWAMILNAAKQVVDFAAWGYASGELAGLTVDVGGTSVTVGENWTGGGATAPSAATTLQRQGNRDHNLASDFATLAPSKGASNSGLTTPFAVELTPLIGGIGYARDDGGLGQGEVIGPPVTDRAVTDGASGSIFLLENHPFTQSGRVTEWSIFSTNGLRVTPLVLRPSGGSYEIVGIGQTRISTGGGLQTYDFNVQSGSDAVQPGDFFGFKDGDNVVDNTGVIEFDDGTADTVRWFGGGKAGSTVVGTTFGAGQTFSRTYSVSASTISTIAPEVDVNVEAAMYNQRSSIYVRYPFSIAATENIDTLALRIRYDDGFVAYLNGVEVARRNAPANATFNATAAADRPIDAVLQFEEINLTASIPLLVGGNNVLAIHGFNDAASSAEFLVEAQLVAAGVSSPEQFGYFTTPTPGGANGSGFSGYVGDTQFDHDRGFYSAPFMLTIATPNTPDATIYYTTNGSDPTPDNAAALVYTAPLNIGGTTTLRAAGYKNGYISSDFDTQTYIFVADVIQQSVISPSIRNDPVWGPQLDDVLLEIPSVSVVSAFDVTQLERATSVELIFPDGTPGFQANAGIEEFGNTSIGFPKNSMRISFKSAYGASKLQYDVFGGDATDEFDQLLLRSSHDSAFYTHGNGTRGVYLRNRWINDQQRAMGEPGPHSRFVHVYLNGTYWGLYDLMERPAAGFMESYFGGEKEDYDSLHDGESVDGDLVAWNAMAAATGNYAQLTQYLDPVNYADYMLMQFYGGNDWDWNAAQNWMASRKRAAGEGFQFFHWDSDMILRTSPTANVVSRGGPGNLFGAIRQHPEFRQILADRAQKWFFNGGVLTSEHVLASLTALADEVEGPIIAESARWGGGTGYTPTIWRQNYDALVAQWVATRTATVVQQLRDAGLFPANNAPTFLINGTPQYGGAANTGAQLSMTAPGQVTTVTTTLVGDTSAAVAMVPANDNLGDSWWQPTFVPGAAGETWTSGQNGVGYDRPPSVDYDPKIRIDVETQMFGAGKNNSVYVRLPFNIADEATRASFTGLTLRMLADDGFVAYLNGVKVAFANAPGEGGNPGVLDWNSNAVTGTEVSISSPAVIDLTAFRQHLRVGGNVLAIHGLNSGNGSSDALFWAELLGVQQSQTPIPAAIYYTLDGSDPQSPGATQYFAPLALNASATVKARSLLAGQWSALSEALFTVSTPLRVTEIMYHPSAQTVEELARTVGGTVVYDADEYEFLELQNIGATTLDLQGHSLADGVGVTIGAESLAPGEYGVVVRNRAAFANRYGAAPRILGEYGGTPQDYRLSNGGETITLLDAAGGVIQSFTYDDAWQAATDGNGPSLVIVNAASPLADWNLAASWRASYDVGGSPSEADSLLGDFNADGRVDLVDLILLQSALGTTSGATRLTGDLTGDGAVTRADVAQFARRYGRDATLTAPSPAVAPAASLVRQATLLAEPRRALAAASPRTARTRLSPPERLAATDLALENTALHVRRRSL